MKSELYSIGDFSRMCRLTVKALRLYDDQGIFKPGHVDPSSGYRYYSSAQLAEANMVRMLRSLELPLEQVREFLQEGDPVAKKKLLEQHRERMEERARSYSSIVASVESLIDGREGIMDRKIEIKDMAEQPVLGVRFKTDMAEIGENIGKAFGRLFAYLGQCGEFPAGPPFALYHDPEYREEDMDVEACVPTARLLEGNEEVKPGKLEGGKAASTLHMGPYDRISGAYGELMTWITENGYRPKSPCREVYLVGPDQAGDPSEYRTEVICPVVKAD